MRKFFLLILALFTMSAEVCFAADELTFTGNIILNGEKVNGSVRVPVPEPVGFWNQDNAPMVMAELFKENGYDKAKPVFTIRTSEPFTVSGSRLNGVYRLQRTIKAGSLNPIGGSKAPFKVPSRPGEYYIGIYPTPEEIGEEDDAGLDQFIKIAVINDSFSDESDTKFPALGICTASNVRLRNAPGTGSKSKIVGRADDSDRLILLGAKSIDGELWFMIDNPFDKGRAYITGRYVEVIDNESQAHKALINMRRTFGLTPAKTRILLGKPSRTLKGNNETTYDMKFIYKGCEIEYINDRIRNIEISQKGWNFGGVHVNDSLQKAYNALGKPYRSYENNEDGLVYEYDLYPDQIEIRFRNNIVTNITCRMYGDPSE